LILAFFAAATTLDASGERTAWQSEQFSFVLGKRWSSCLKLEDMGSIVVRA